MTEKAKNPRVHDLTWFHLMVYEDEDKFRVVERDQGFVIGGDLDEFRGPYVMAAQMLLRYKEKTGKEFGPDEDGSKRLVVFDKLARGADAHPGYGIFMDGVFVHYVPDDGSGHLYGKTMELLAIRGGGRSFKTGNSITMAF